MGFLFIIVLARQYYNIPLGLKYRGTADKGIWALMKLRGTISQDQVFIPLPPLEIELFLSFSWRDPESKVQLVDFHTIFLRIGGDVPFLMRTQKKSQPLVQHIPTNKEHLQESQENGTGIVHIPVMKTARGLPQGTVRVTELPPFPSHSKQNTWTAY